MNSVIDAVLSFSIPDEIREMTSEEYAKYFRPSKEEKYGFINEEKHTVFTVIYKKRGFLLGRAASLEACLNATEKKIEKNIPTYENLGYKDRVVDGEDAKSFCFEYEIQDSKQMGEYVLCRFPKFFCSFEMLCKDEYKDFAEEKFEEFLGGIKFKK